MRSQSVSASELILILAVGTLLGFSQTTGPVLRISTNSLSFAVHRGGNTPSPLTVGISNAGGGQLKWTAEATTTNGLSWLSVSPASGTGAATLTVSVSSLVLASDTYIGFVQVSGGEAGNSPQTITVTLQVTDPDKATISLWPTSLSLGVPLGGTPQPQILQLQNVGGGTLGWTASVASQGEWLAITPTTGVAPSTISVTANAANLPTGTYIGTVTFTALPGSEATNSPQVFVVTLGVGTPVINENGVVNAASFSTDAVVSPGSIASIFGRGLAGETLAVPTLPLPTALGGVRVEVNGTAAPIFFVSPTQINFQVPTNMITDSLVVRVCFGPLRGPDYFGRLVFEAPGIFATRGTQAAAANQDSSFNSAENPAAAGSVVQVYATGLGATDPAIPSGHPGAFSEPFNRTVATPVVLIDRLPAEVLFSAVAPGFVGLYQVNARIPAGTVPGASVPLQIQMNGYTSNTVTLAVKAPH